MENKARNFLLSRKSGVNFLFFSFYFIAAFVVANFCVQILKNTNSVYAEEAATATSTLSIPSISLTAPVTTIPFTGPKLDVPEQIAGSYSVHDNKTLIIGHSSTIFQGLKETKIGEKITLNNKMYQIMKIEEKAKSDISMQDVLQEENIDTIILMTCSGESIPGTDGDHTHRLIVTATISE